MTGQLRFGNWRRATFCPRRNRTNIPRQCSPQPSHHKYHANALKMYVKMSFKRSKLHPSMNIFIYVHIWHCMTQPVRSLLAVNYLNWLIRALSFYIYTLAYNSVQKFYYCNHTVFTLYLLTRNGLVILMLYHSDYWRWLSSRNMSDRKQLHRAESLLRSLQVLS